jgi:hypothetical protein
VCRKVGSKEERKEKKIKAVMRDERKGSRVVLF